MSDDVWRVRPAGSTDAGRTVRFSRLAQAIEAEEIGALDEVQGPGESTWFPLGEHPRTAELLPSRRRFRSQRPEDAESDLTPMIDVTFQLVIFFMIAATYTVQKTLDLPTSPDEGPVKVTQQQLERDNLMVEIDSSGTVTLQDEVVPLDDLPRRLRQARRQQRTAELVLDVHDEALHEIVVGVLDAASAAEIEEVLFIKRSGDR